MPMPCGAKCGKHTGCVPRRAYRSVCEERKQSGSSKELVSAGCGVSKHYRMYMLANYRKTGRNR